MNPNRKGGMQNNAYLSRKEYTACSERTARHEGVGTIPTRQVQQKVANHGFPWAVNPSLSFKLDQPKGYIMKRYPQGTAATKAPSLVVTGFKLAIGAYLGWNVMTGIDRGLGKSLTKKFGSPEELIGKIQAWGERQKEKS